MLRFATVLWLLCTATGASAHGSVTPEEDLCLIRIGYYSAHFKVYLPHSRGHQQFCEDLPAAGESIFVMEYEHAGLSTAAIDFRIIENVTGQGRFARLRDVERIKNIDAHTVYHLPPASQRDVYTAMYEFRERGEFIGIVKAEEPVTGEVYTAVFPFSVGFGGFGYWPLFALLALVMQINYLWMSGWFSARRWRGLIPARIFPLLAVTFVLALSPEIAVLASDDVENADTSELGTWRSARYLVAVEPQVSPVPINRMHSWMLRVTSRDGQPVENALISVSGGMPEHDHGLPTRPEVSRHLGEGRYLLQGLRFHMHGHWQLELHVDDGESSDVVNIDFVL